MRNHKSTHSTAPYEWSAGYIPLAVMVGMEMLAAMTVMKIIVVACAVV